MRAITITPIAQRETDSVTRSQTASHRASSPGASTLAEGALHVADVRQQEEAREEDRERGDEDREAGAGQPEHAGDRVGHPLGKVLRALLHVLRGSRVAEERELARLAQLLDDRRQVLEEVAHVSDDPHEEEQREQRDRERGAEHGDGRRQAA